jgi:short-subunit dehydrogenase
MEIAGSIAVVTGASSGIGRATALELARRGAGLVVAARREEPLVSLVDECKRHGAEALAVPTDVTDPGAVERLAERARERFGHVDAWVNNAGVYLVGRFEDTPLEAFRRVLEVNLLGCVHGARAILPHFRSRRAGVLVNVASVDAHVPAPLVSAYVASKFAVLGWSESLRQELRDLEDVHVAVVSPAASDTPLFQHAANYSGRPVKALTPTYAPQQVAETIAALIERPQREVIVGAAGRLLARQRRLAPALTDRIFAKQMSVDQFGDGAAAPTDGNLFEPIAHGTEETGGWRTVHPRTRRRALVVGTATGVVGLTVLALRR